MLPLRGTIINPGLHSNSYVTLAFLALASNGFPFERFLLTIEVIILLSSTCELVVDIPSAS